MKLRRRLGRTALILTSALAFSRSTAYIRFTNLPIEQLPGAIAAFNMPVEVWIYAWAVVGLVALVAAVRVKTWGFYPTVAMCLMWFVGYMFALSDVGSRTGPTAALYLVIAAFLVIIAVDIDRPATVEENRE